VAVLIGRLAPQHLFALLTDWPPQNAVADAEDGASAIVAVNAASKLRSKLPFFNVSRIRLLLLVVMAVVLATTEALVSRGSSHGPPKPCVYSPHSIEKLDYFKIINCIFVIEAERRGIARQSLKR
jgi:hypothetical protein